MQYSENKTLVIAEAGVNHNGSLTLAKQLVDVALEAKVDFIKFQTFNACELVCVDAPKAEYQKAFEPDNSQLEMLKSLELSQHQQIELYQYCESRGIKFLSSPFDLQSLDFLDVKLRLPLIKIGSGEITNLPLLWKAAQKGKLLILSTGMSTLGDIEIALGILAAGYLNADYGQYPSLELCNEVFFSEEGQSILRDKVSLLHCTSEYPAPFSEVNLSVMKTLKQAFGLPVGYSDHTPGINISIAAVACGATIIEKHFTLDKTLTGPDHQASITPEELISLVKGVREVELALGNGKKIPTKNECKNRLIARKSLVAINKIDKGEKFTENNLGCKRPGMGISPIFFNNILDKTSEKNYNQDDLIRI